MKALGFDYQFIPGTSDRTLLLLHGTGGDENDLLALGPVIEETASLLSPRGKVSENGANRFFRRLAEGVFDETDVIARAEELAGFVDAAAEKHGITRSLVTAVGYSNGANIAAAMILLGVAKFASAILFRPMVPLSHPPSISLGQVPILLCGGRSDPIATMAQVNALAALLTNRGAEVQVQFQPAAHELTQVDVQNARDWLAAAAIA